MAACSGTSIQPLSEVPREAKRSHHTTCSNLSSDSASIKQRTAINCPLRLRASPSKFQPQLSQPKLFKFYQHAKIISKRNAVTILRKGSSYILPLCPAACITTSRASKTTSACILFSHYKTTFFLSNKIFQARSNKFKLSHNY